MNFSSLDLFSFPWPTSPVSILILSFTVLFILLLIPTLPALIWIYTRRSKQLNTFKEELLRRTSDFQQHLERRLGEQSLDQTKETALFKEFFFRTQSEFKDAIHKHQFDFKETVLKNSGEFNESLLKTLSDFRQTLLNTFGRHQEDISTRLQHLTMQVEKHLSEGFEKTTATFSDMIKRLALIDDAQKQLMALSSNVVSLQEILIDKRSRGAFGEIQLKNLVENVLPPQHFEFQYTLGNGNRVDCLLRLPMPTGNIAIDSKFPLENYQKMTDFEASVLDRKKSQQLFYQDIKKHITDIKNKYILPPETAEGAILFIPAEAVFSEIHAHFPDLVELAQRANVWLASPTTLMAILNTARSVIKDLATKKHIHTIQEHLRLLSNDFERFETRMNALAKHIDQAHQDVQQVQTSALKISNRFQQIEKADLPVDELS